MSKEIKITVIVAAALNNVIGRDNAMPWRLSTDLKRFKALTLGKPVIMGRKTFESIGRPLPERLNIIVTRDADFTAENVTIVDSLDKAFSLAKAYASEHSLDEVCVIGGGQIYQQVINFADQINLTRVLTEVEGDTLFPELEPEKWQLVYQEAIPAGEKDNYPTHYCVYKSVKGSSA